MIDQRVVKLADTLVNHSVEVKEGDKVLIIGTSEATPLIKEVYRKVLQNGGHPFTHVTLPGLEKIFYTEANEDQLANIELLEMLIKNVDVFISINGVTNTKELSNVDPVKLQLFQKAQEPIMEYAMKGNLRWVGTLFPTNAAAQDAEMSLEEYEEFVFGATNVDYSELYNTMKQAAQLFNKANKVRIVANETDITIDIEGREATICDGKNNVPDGEFYYTPNHFKTEGTIYYEWPTVIGGREVQGIRLTFKEGKIIEYSAEKGYEFLDQFLNIDEGARYLGELGIGTNPAIQNPTKNILFDEKIGGSIHLAVGRAYEDGNISAIHWDMVKNLKNGGEIYVDGKLVQKNGEWIHNKLKEEAPKC